MQAREGNSTLRERGEDTLLQRCEPCAVLLPASPGSLGGKSVPMPGPGNVAAGRLHRLLP